MIARLRGRPVARTADGLVLDVGGVGYLVAATPSRAPSARKATPEVTVETYLHVREDALQLYGFADAAERELFIALLGVSGVGPKVALAVVSGSPHRELRRAIVLGDAARFQAIPGIGKKTAERIVLELKDKLGDDDVVPPSALRAARRRMSSPATRSSSSGTRWPRPSRRSRRSTRSCRRRSASAWR